VNGRLPNQDIVNSVAHVARWAGGVPPRLHDIDDSIEDKEFGPSWIKGHVGRYLLAAEHLLRHFAFAATGRASAAHGVLAK
jgi:glycosylphosphatidylinositol transamidase